MYIFSDFDRWQEALKQIDLNESALPIYNGHFLVENGDVYAKIQKLLNCKTMEPSHRWLYSLDLESIDESERNKVNNLYKLACERGAIQDDEQKTDECDILPVQDPQSSNMQPDVSKPEPQSVKAAPTTAYTVLYSAIRSDGRIKTGEAYSNALNTMSAKVDVMSKLEKAGYHDITILAIEAGDPDMQGCDNTYVKQPYSSMDILGDDAELSEADDKEDSDADKSDDDKDEDSEDSDDSEDADDKDEDSDDENKTEETAEEPDEKLKDGDDSEDKADDKEDSDADKSDDDKDEDSEDSEDSDDSEDADDKDEDSDDSDEEDSNEEELSDDKKAQLKDSYKKAFKAAMLKCKFTDRSFSDLTLEEKVDFFTKLSDAWGDKADPVKFMTDKEIDQLESIVVKK